MNGVKLIIIFIYLYRNIKKKMNLELLRELSLGNKRIKILGDCFDYLPYVSEKSVDLIFADLPYGTTKCSWDSLLDLELLWKHYKRIIKDEGVILLFAQTPFDKVLGSSNLDMLRYEWIWEKNHATGHFNAKKMPMKAHENILVFYKKLGTYNPQKTKGHKPVNNFIKKKVVSDKSNIYGKNVKDVKGGGSTERYPRDVLKFGSDRVRNKKLGIHHETAKPVALIEYMIKTYTNEGDLVLDNVAGSGPVVEVCEKINRQYIVMEKDPVNFEMINKRLLYL